jgi:DNA-binding MarR family transcriptional regulator
MTKKSQLREVCPATPADCPTDKDALLEQCALFDVHRVARILTSHYNAHLRPSGLSMAQFTLIRNIAALGTGGQSHMSKVAEAMLMDRTSVTRMIEPLVSNGLLEVLPNPADRRVRDVRVTRKGEQALVRSERCWKRAQEELYSTIGSKQWLAMRRALRETVHLVRHSDAEHAAAKFSHL